jgi:2-polyprenyl-3-methyl-5-hydroxy-6-metoxy-1,4-benzoquinol methylase
MNRFGLLFSQAFKFVFRPIVSRIRRNLILLLNQDKIQESLASLDKRHDNMQKSLNDLTKQYDKSYTVLIDLLEKSCNETAGMVAISKDQSSIYIANGFIDADSYLALSMLNENEALIEIKNKYGDDGWYYLFEKIFRGSEAEIERRQSIYISYFQDCYSALADRNDQGYFLDFGSGRGEFLSLLAKENLPGRGVDTNRLNIDHVEKKGLDAICVDGINYIEGVKDNALFGITMFQVAEHLQFDMLKSFISAAYRKIMPGGIVLIETVNPSCSRAMQYFYVDPSHVRPYPPELLKFHAEWVGFVDVKIIFYMPVFEVNTEVQSNYIGYALIGYKPIDTVSELISLNLTSNS